MVFSQSNTLKLYLFLNDVIFDINSQISHNFKILPNFLISIPCSHKIIIYKIIYARFHASIQKSRRFSCDFVSVMRDVSRASYELRRSESGKAKLEERAII